MRASGSGMSPSWRSLSKLETGMRHRSAASTRLRYSTLHAVSAMTLREGIARAITEAIPEVSEVVDVTDHSLGENPYYT